ncbi:hypothetical protein [Shewanella sp. CG12_big_fil_rev_8_21_14_0_65_47_15]|uniref:hypothetical protein n=1 Tax=Shewanella sp. CG12_big_fil_rev_8_21_14_0_65_47_15 TaxID=1975537 RepID=UPI0025DC9126|nr:hypothetical protein [Shewanella sp. CG12_big_fil_rev_8_21_14_0_65_47_15]
MKSRLIALLFAHALIGSSEVRDFFFNKCDIELKGEEVEVYVEPAPLRDYWYALGNPQKHSKATEMVRKQVLSQFLAHYQVGLAYLSILLGRVVMARFSIICVQNRSLGRLPNDLWLLVFPTANFLA